MTSPTVKRKRLLNQKGRREGGSFFSLPHAVMDSENWRRCSATAIKLLCALMRQFNGKNNGDLTAAMAVLRPLGWTSSDTVTYALKELRHYGLITLTRQGMMKKCSLYALTWLPIDECKNKLDVPSTKTAPGDWKHSRPPFKRPAKKRNPTPPGGENSHRLAEQKQLRCTA